MRSILILIISMIISLPAVCPAEERPDIEQAPACKYCGMNRRHYAHSRMLVDYENGTASGTCSLHCTAVDLVVNAAKVPTSIKVGDYNTKELIDAETAIWVVGGNKPGVMTRRAKWAFGDLRRATEFVERYGGSIVSFDDAIKATFDDMFLDTIMIRNKKRIMKMLN